MRGAWVEISAIESAIDAAKESLPVRGAWVEMRLLNLTPEEIKSLPVRGAWVEIQSNP